MRISDWSSVVCSSDLARAEAVQAGEVLVAGRLVDNPLAAQLGLDRLDRDAVRLHAAVAAALADQLVDADALVRVREGAVLAPAAFLRGPGLVVVQDGRSRALAQIALHPAPRPAVLDPGSGGGDH